jgi:hypothetical protein
MNSHELLGIVGGLLESLKVDGGELMRNQRDIDES